MLAEILPEILPEILGELKKRVVTFLGAVVTFLGAVVTFLGAKLANVSISAKVCLIKYNCRFSGFSVVEEVTP